MQTDRRTFGKVLSVGGLSLSMGSFLGMTGCNVYDNIAKYVAVGLQSFQSVIDLLTGAGVINTGTGSTIDTLIALVKAAFADISAAVAAYESAPADQKQTFAQKVALAITIAEAQIQQFWNDLNIPDPKLASLIQGLLGIILSTLSGFLTQLPAPPPSSIAVRAKALPKQIPFTVKRRTVREFKSDFNNLLVQNGHAKAL